LFRWYRLLLDAEETDQPAEAELARLVLQGDFAGALERLKRWDRRSEQGVTFVASQAERLGDQARAEKHPAWPGLLELSEDALRDYASGATSGAEGLGRMADVERLVKKRRG
jgi:hypothetical protein